jgi:biopolymer transport protein ExbD
VGELPTTKESLPMEIGIATGMARDTRLYIRADRSIPYDELIAVMNILRGEGYLKVGLVGLDEAAAPPEGTETAEVSQ